MCEIDLSCPLGSIHKLNDDQILQKLKGYQNTSECIKLNLAHNNLTHIIDFHNLWQFKKLTHLKLWGNKIQCLDVSCLPKTITVLDVELCGIIKISGCLQTLEHLKELNLQSNYLETIPSLPPYVESLRINRNPIRIFKRDTFPNKQTYAILIEELDRNGYTKHIQLPPPAILKSGYEPVVQYYEEVARFGSVDISSNILLLVGDSSETSQTVSWLLGIGDTGSLSDNVLHSPVKYEIDDNIFYYVLQMTFDLYCNAYHLIRSDNTHILVHHNVSKPGFPLYCSEFFHDILQQARTNAHFVLTNIEDACPQILEYNIGMFKQELNKMLTDEFSSIEDRKLKYDRCQIVTSTDESIQTEQILGSIEEMKKKTRIFQLTRNTDNDIQKLRKFLEKQARTKLRTLPQNWTRFQGAIVNTDVSILQACDAEEIFQKCSRPVNDIQTFHMCMEYLKYTGICLWKKHSDTLGNTIFCNSQCFIDILSNILSNNILNSISAETLREFPLFFDGSEFQEIKLQCENSGLLSRKAVGFLLRTFSLESEDINAFLELLMSYDFCYKIITKHKSNIQREKYYFPHVVKNRSSKTLGPDIHTLIASNKVKLFMECQFYEHIPSNLFPSMCVKVQSFALQHHYNGSQTAYLNAVQVTLDRVECHLFKKLRTHSICCSVASPVEDLAKAWEILEYVKEELDSTIQQWGVISKSFHVICFHCLFRGIRPPYMWPVKTVFDRSEELFVRCHHEKDHNVPVALILPVSPERNNYQSTIQAVSVYLKENKDLSHHLGEPVSNEIKIHLRTHMVKFETAMFCKPVIDILFTKGVLTLDQKYTINRMTSTKKVEFLFHDIIWSGTRKTLDCFSQALQESGYHTNLSLAKVLSSGISQENESDFLTLEETEILRGPFYQSFKEFCPVENIKPELFSRGILHKYHLEELNSHITQSNKASYILDEVLLRGTYETVQGFRDALTKLQDNGYLCQKVKMLKSYLPQREQESCN